MCGIAGLININFEKVSPKILEKMNNSIRHRGPDGKGLWIEDNIGIGHRRLAIIDRSSSAKQPMISSDGRYILSYNGEIYNYIEIRSLLEKAGFNFKSKSDTEVVLYALIYWGNKAFIKFNGMFALALWDRKTKKLLLARDRYGIKPLYYGIQNQQFYFGSEQKVITSNPIFSKKLNKSALLEYFTFQNIFSNQTFFKDIFLLSAGSYIEYKYKQNSLKEYEYWDYQFNEPKEKLDKKSYLNNLNFLFTKAVEKQLVGDVEVGTYLSGGMDSGSITAIASKSVPFLKSFTCGFDLSSASGVELSFDERSEAEAMSAYFKTEHYQMVLKAGDMERCLKSLTWHLEEPRVGQSYPNFYAAKLTSKFVKVVLSGTGGDELFGGYPWRYYRGARAKSFEEYIDNYYQYWQRLLSNTEIKAVFSPIWKDVNHILTRDIFRNVFKKHKNKLSSPEDYINHSLYFEAKTFLHGLLIVEDKLSMAHSLENRVPFMDNDLVDFAMNCPVGLKLNNLSNVINIDENDHVSKKNKYFKKTNDGKQILREVMTNHLPKIITEAPKKGFSSPDASWFKGESIDFVKNTLINNKASINEIFDKNALIPLVEEHLNGENNRRLLIWSLLNVETWLKENEFV
tara:strand:- start:21 stop:1898 length:1878 start_codon:yes stop_codon:yes gene_type:complete